MLDTNKRNKILWLVILITILSACMYSLTKEESNSNPFSNQKNLFFEKDTIRLANYRTRQMSTDIELDTVPKLSVKRSEKIQDDR